jgi:DNA-3-methyladenine glycosylase II
MALARQDAWPSGDLALASAVQSAKQLPSLPDPQALERLGNDYRPYRAVAARIYWHFYLSRKENGK